MRERKIKEFKDVFAVKLGKEYRIDESPQQLNLKMIMQPEKKLTLLVQDQLHQTLEHLQMIK